MAFGLLKLMHTQLGKKFIILVIAINLILCYDYNYNYGIGSPKVMNYIRDNDKVTSIYFFTDCHPGPWYSSVHRNITMLFPECYPIKIPYLNEM